jgi:hypothetical protein
MCTCLLQFPSLAKLNHTSRSPPSDEFCFATPRATWCWRPCRPITQVHRLRCLNSLRMRGVFARKCWHVAGVVDDDRSPKRPLPKHPRGRRLPRWAVRLLGDLPALLRPIIIFVGLNNTACSEKHRKFSSINSFIKESPSYKSA